MPDLVRQMEKRALFCDWMLRTGIFGWHQLDEVYSDLYNRIRAEYLERQRILRLNGLDPDCETV